MFFVVPVACLKLEQSSACDFALVALRIPVKQIKWGEEKEDIG